MVYIENKLRQLRTNRCCRKFEGNNLNPKRVHRVKKRDAAIGDNLKNAGVIKNKELRSLEWTEEKLRLKREEAERRRKHLVKQWNTLTRNEQYFRKVVIQFNHFVKQNRDKLERKSRELQILWERKWARQVLIKNMQRDIEEYKEIVDLMNDKIAKHLLYEDFLDKTQERFVLKNKEEIMFRIAGLLDASVRLDEITRENELKTLYYNFQYHRVIDYWTRETVRMTETLSIQSEKYDYAMRQVRHWQAIVQDIGTHLQTTWSEFKMIRNYLDNILGLLHIRVRARGGISETEFLERMTATPEDKIAYINKILQNIVQVKRSVRRIVEKQKTIGTETEEYSKPVTKKNKSVGDRKLSIDDPKARKLSIEELKPRRQPLEEPKMWFIQETTTKKPSLPPVTRYTAELLDKIKTDIQNAAKKTRKRRRSVRSSGGSSDTESSGSASFKETMSDNMLSQKYWDKETEQLTPVVEAAVEEPDYHSRRDTWCSKLVPVPFKYSCTTITNETMDQILDRRMSKSQDRIIERNFDRYETKYNYPPTEVTKSSIRDNKKTGKLPKLHYENARIGLKSKSQTREKLILPKLKDTDSTRSAKSSIKNSLKSNGSVKYDIVSDNFDLEEFDFSNLQ